jgi:hypothetical protein
MDYTLLIDKYPLNGYRSRHSPLDCTIYFQTPNEIFDLQHMQNLLLVLYLAMNFLPLEYLI